MTPQDLEKIDTFLGLTGQASLLEYYGIKADAAPKDIETKIKTQRTWAQAQQANPDRKSVV